MITSVSCCSALTQLALHDCGHFSGLMQRPHTAGTAWLWSLQCADAAPSHSWHCLTVVTSVCWCSALTQLALPDCGHFSELLQRPHTAGTAWLWSLQCADATQSCAKVTLSLRVDFKWVRRLGMKSVLLPNFFRY